MSLQNLQPLLDPRKIITLASPRALNQRFRRVLYWLHQAEAEGHDPSEALWRAMKMAGADKRVKGLKCTLNPTLDHAQIMKEYRALKEQGLFTPGNLAKMKNGEAIKNHSGETLELNHIIPKKHAPELENSWSNLEHMPVSVNRKLQDKLTPEGRAQLERYVQNEDISRARADRILADATKDQPALR